MSTISPKLISFAGWGVSTYPAVPYTESIPYLWTSSTYPTQTLLHLFWELHTVFKEWTKQQFIQWQYDTSWFVLCSLPAFGLPFFDHYFTLSWRFLGTICHNSKTPLLRSHHPLNVHYFMWKAQLILPLVQNFMFSFPTLHFMLVSCPITQIFLQLFLLSTFTW